MTLPEALQLLVAAVRTAAQVLNGLATISTGLRKLFPSLSPGVGYMNVRLDLELDIDDVRGHRAILYRRQRIRFLRADSEPVRDLVWGEGTPVARYTASGAQRLGIVPEGSKQAVLLRVPPVARQGTKATILSRRLIKDGLVGRSEYFEALVERPTSHLAMRILFPPERPPRDAVLVTSPRRADGRRVPVRYGADGRPTLSWRVRVPVPDTVYCLRWSW